LPAPGDLWQGARDDFHQEETMATKTVSVPGISCGHCVATIERELADVAGVTAVKADEAGKTVTVTWTEADTGWSAIAATLDEIGYPAAEG
jgi:copper chaperone CopZ